MRSTLCGLIATLLFARLAVAANPAEAKDGQFDLEKTKTVLSGLIEKTLQDKGVPSISIALVRKDEIVWRAAFGYANVRGKTLATPETMYNAASTFKSVTATALLQLAEQGKFKLDHPVNRYLGDVGSYEVGDDVFDITREGEKLFVQKNKNKKGEMLAETSTTFFIKGNPATVSFEANPAGEVDRMAIFEPDWQLTVGKRRQ